MRTCLFLLFLLTACAALRGFRTREFTYVNGGRSERLVLKVPSGYAQERMVLDTIVGGKEQFYYYDNGALLYLTRNVSWQTENQPFIKNTSPKQNGSNGFTYKGMDKDGLHWKEVRIDSFRFGYSYVPSHLVEEFETAIHSLRVRKKAQ